MGKKGTSGIYPTQATTQINSKSYIILECSEDSDIIELRTDPPTLITLKKGKNILKIEDYPDLKYGFKAHLDEDEMWTDKKYFITNMDFSHFEASQMTSMEEMFCGMEINSEDLYGLDTSNVISMKRTFGYSILPNKFRLNIDTRKVTVMDDMFWFCDVLSNFDELDLSCFKVHNVESINDFFRVPPRKLILDGWKFTGDGAIGNIFGEDGYGWKNTVISLKDSNIETIRKISQEIKYQCEWFSEADEICLIIEKKRGQEFIIHSHPKSQLIVRFSQNGKELSSIIKKDLEYFIVPYGVTTISDKAFEGCKNLHTIFLPETLNSIGDEAFNGCENLKWINMPDSLISIGSKAFQDCKSLKTLWIGEKTTLIGDEAFSGSGIENLTLPESYKDGNNIFKGAENLSFINLYISERLKPSLSKGFIYIHNYYFTKYPQINKLKSLSLKEKLEWGYTKNGVVLYISMDEENEDMVRNSTNEEIFEMDVYYTLRAIWVPEQAIAIPEEVITIEGNSISPQRECPFLYIPNSVAYIGKQNVLNENRLNLITKEDNFHDLIDILPSDAKMINIHLT